ncbi:hypothetical protein J0H58_12565 [bacterium]|nr:hypothetical protein [bacterium]
MDDEEAKKRAAVLKYYFDAARKCADVTNNMVYDEGYGSDPSRWSLETMRRFAANLRRVGEQFYLLSIAFEESYPVLAPEFTEESLHFLAFLGVKKATIAKRVKSARGTVYAALDKWEKDLQARIEKEGGVSIERGEDGKITVRDAKEVISAKKGKPKRQG